MNKRNIIYLFAGSLVFLGVGLFFKNSIEFNLCLISEPACIDKYTSLGNILFYGMRALALVFLVLLFTPQAFPKWKKFAVWFVPLTTILFIFYPNPGAGDYFSPYPEQVYQWVSYLYIAISALIILSSLKKNK